MARPGETAGTEDFVIRPARSDEIGRLGAVERDGDRRYDGYDGIPAGFDDVVAPAVLEAGRQEGRLWLAVTRAGAGSGRDSDDAEIIGFVLAQIVDGSAHLAQVSVRLSRQGQGVGRRLIETVVGWARGEGMAQLSLCTFADVGWNRPLYEHLGFSVLAEERWPPGLRVVFESDGPLGLDLGRRVIMVRDLALP
jgi:GNAT superfamily N-acetyltransferase